MKILSDIQLQAIEMLCTGDYSKQEIAYFVQVDRSTIYNWLKDKDFVAKLEESLQEIKTQANKEFTSRLPKAIEEYWKICTSTTDIRTKEKALSTWIERSLGRIASTVNINDETKDDNIDVLAVFEEVEGEDGEEN